MTGGIFVDNSCKRLRTGLEGQGGYPFMRRSLMTGVNRCHSTGSLAQTQLEICRQQQLGVDEDVTFWNIPIRIRQEFNSPFPGGILDTRVLISENALRISSQGRITVANGDFSC